MLRIRLLLSCVLVLAGSNLLAETPESEPQPRLAPAVLDVRPTLARPINGIQPARLDRPAPNASAIELLRTKQKQLEQLQNEVGELEKSLGVAPQYQVECIMGRVDMARLRDADPEIQWEQEKILISDFLDQAKLGRNIPVEQFRAVQACLDGLNVMHTLMSQHLVLNAFQSASQHVGGQFALPAPAQNGGPVQWKDFGTSVTAKIIPTDSRRVRIQIQPEHVERDFSHAVKIGGEKIPALKSYGLNFEADLQLGETLIRTMKSNADTESLLLFAVTVHTITPPTPVAATPHLKPIPENSNLR